MRTAPKLRISPRSPAYRNVSWKIKTKAVIIFSNSLGFLLQHFSPLSNLPGVKLRGKLCRRKLPNPICSSCDKSRCLSALGNLFFFFEILWQKFEPTVCCWSAKDWKNWVVQPRENNLYKLYTKHYMIEHSTERIDL